MEALFKYLKQIYELLEQISSITDNQTTVLLTSNEGEQEDENESLDMIAQMADYKDELTSQLIDTENMFQRQYDSCKQFLSDGEAVETLKKLVASVLKLKEAIIAQEQSNLLLLQGRSKRNLEQIHIVQDPKNAVAAYKKQQETSEAKK